MISLFNNVTDTKPKECNIYDWLRWTINPPQEWLKKVELYRETGIKKYKLELPCITISAQFKDVRNLENIEKHSGFICIDIDRYSKKGKCNICVDMQLAKELIMQHPSCLYVGRSVGNDGIYAIFKIFDGSKLLDYFKYFETRLQRVGINIDEVCSDATRLRIFSYDPDAYLNLECKPLQLGIKKEQKRYNKTVTDNEQRIIKLIEVINHNRIDITDSYKDWYKIGGAIYQEFGDFGENYFHEISKFNAGYNYEECSKQWKNSMKLSKVTFSTLFYIADSYGVRY